MVRVNKEYVLNEVLRNGYIHYTAKDTAGNTISMHESEDSTGGDTVERLNNLFDSAKGVIQLHLRNKKASELGKGGNTRGGVKLEINLNESSNVPAPIGHVPSTSNDEVIEAIEKRYQDKIEHLKEMHKRDLEHLDLKNQLEELKEGKTDGIGAIAEVLAGVFLKNNEVSGAGAGIHGPNDKELVIQSVNRLQKLDPDFGTNIKLLADLAESNFSIYELAISQLKSMSQ